MIILVLEKRIWGLRRNLGDRGECKLGRVRVVERSLVPPVFLILSVFTACGPRVPTMPDDSSDDVTYILAVTRRDGEVEEE